MTIKTNLSIMLASIALLLLLVGQAFAGSLNLDGNGVAIKGYDPVSYHVQNAAVKGKPSISATHQGGTYHFSSEANRQKFNANPARYVPAYGGFCAYGVASGYKVKIEPDQFSVVDGKLYLNYDASVQRRWKKDVPGYITEANSQWTRVANQ